MKLQKKIHKEQVKFRVAKGMKVISDVASSRMCLLAFYVFTLFTNTLTISIVDWNNSNSKPEQAQKWELINQTNFSTSEKLNFCKIDFQTAFHKLNASVTTLKLKLNRLNVKKKQTMCIYACSKLMENHIAYRFRLHIDCQIFPWNCLITVGQ